MSNGYQDSDVWVRRLKAAGCIVDQIMRYVGPFLLAWSLYIQNQTRLEVGVVDANVVKAKTEIKVVAQNAATSAKVAADTAKTAVEGKDEQRIIAETGLANALQWKAYNTKEPDDIEKARYAIERVESLSIPNQPAIKAPPEP